MGVNWTREQQQVIDLRDANILVAAAAGSGKTAVLVERIIARLTRDEHPLNVDELLIVTFTEAAAAEMKERILSAIEKALEGQPENQHLQHQATLIHSANITTIHSFCLSVIRDHFHTIDLDPVFRIGEEGELKLLKKDTMDQLLEQEYEGKREEFIYFVECIAPGKRDKGMESLIQNLFEFSRSNPQPERWLQDCVEKYQIVNEKELSDSSVGIFLREMIALQLGEMKGKVDRAIAICREVGGPHHYEDALQADKVLFEYLESQLKTVQEDGEMSTLEVLYQGITCMDWEPLSRKRPKDVEKEKREIVGGIRNEYKKVVKDWKDKYFFTSPANQIRLIQDSGRLVKELVYLVNAYADLYAREKSGRSILDFNDMEQYALKILTQVSENGMVPSEVAREYQNKFAEVMIDEYQDSNLVQEAILTSVSKVSQGTYNMFMVGDVKQSIYRFRLSRPELFMYKFNTYSLDGGEERRIDLSMNFRSRDEVLESTNYIFYQIMKSLLGGVEYDKKAALYCGASFPNHEGEADNKTELLLIDDKEVKESEDIEENTRELEARMVARKIKELVGNHPIYDKHTDGYRPARYSDVVLLTRSLSGWSDVFSEILGKEGVPTSVASREGYFTTFEVALLLDYLRVIDNPKQDIPLTAVLRSMFGSMTDQELAIIKGEFPRYKFHDAVSAYGKKTELEKEKKQIQSKLNKCLSRIEVFREKVSFLSIQELIWEILQETHYREYVYAMPGGGQRRANIDMLLEKATTFEGTSYKGVFHFIRYVEQLQKYQVEYGEANMVDELDDVVRIMSIHKSKGLEFPIVFVIGMGKEFNKQDVRGPVAIHPDEGIGMDAIYPETRLKSTVLNKQVIRRRLDLDSLGEELRILYVAMTRAKEKLILTGKVRDLDKTLEKLRVEIEDVDTKNRSLGFLDLANARTYLDWVLPCVYLKAESPIIVRKVSIEDLIQEEMIEEIQGIKTQVSLKQLGGEEIYDEVFRAEIEEQFTFQYPFAEEGDFKLKMSVTEIKKRIHMLEEIAAGKTLEEVQEKRAYSRFVPQVPEFMKKDEQEEVGAFRGTSYHRFLELWDFTKSFEAKDLEKLLESYQKQGKMSVEMTSYIQPDVISEFMKNPLAERMKKAAKNKQFFKEQPFVLGVPSSKIYGVDSQETILVQGIIDVYFEEQDGLVVVDYKTDKVKSLQELAKRYYAQLDYYADALEQLTGKKVKERIIYSLTLQKYIRV